MWQLSRGDRELIRRRGKSEDEVQCEIELLSRPSPFVRLVRPCRPDDGILRVSPDEATSLVETYRKHAARALKFVAASGAASRMFAGIESQPEFFRNLRRFAFYGALCKALESRGHRIDELLSQGRHAEIIECLLGDGGLGYARAPKGLIPFNCYPDGPRTPFEEHLVEAQGHGVTKVHFTVPPGDEERVRRHLQPWTSRSGIEVTISEQRRRTDALALDEDNRPVRDEKGELVFWPSGHGALLDNLEELHGDIVFVRTIDNVLPDSRKPLVSRYKQIIGGLLIKIQEESHRKLDNRPVRVCAMVRHDGLPGGGPFWVADSEGRESLQIVERAQVDATSDEQKRIWESSEYFNPADLVCAVRDFEGKPFHLIDYQDPATYFVSHKIYDGRPIKVLERPGLWNGGMARWNTFFVEVPRETLRPVKNIMDLIG